MGPPMRGRGRGPPPGYGPHNPGYVAYGAPPIAGDGPRRGSPHVENAMRGPSPGAPIGEEIEMQDSPSGANLAAPGDDRYANPDSDFHGMVGLTQPRQRSPVPVTSPSSIYSTPE